jgi:hypothetical protein
MKRRAKQTEKPHAKKRRDRRRQEEADAEKKRKKDNTVSESNEIQITW